MVSLKNITKQFSGVHALRDVSIDFPEGKVIALVGENGAGKSTLMNILSGVYQDFEGELFYKGKTVRFADPKQAQELGITIIHQELNLIPQLTVYENIFLGRELVNQWGVLDRQAMHRQAGSLLQRLRLAVDPGTKASRLKVGECQVVEIAKALLVDSDFVIMDEPTSAISETEVRALFRVIADLRASGKTVVYISHKMDELFEIADEYVVLRDGQVVQQGQMADVDEHQLISLMVGRTLDESYRKGVHISTAVALRVEDLALLHPSKPGMRLQDITFELHKGEILGIFGLMGAGRTELLEALFGLRGKPACGQLFVDQQPLPFFASPADALRNGIALIPEDRKQDGLVLGMDVRTNLTLSVLDRLEHIGVIDETGERTLCQYYIDRLGIKLASTQQAVGSLSGGNQQKVVLAKYLATRPIVLMMDEPTRGVDVNAKREIYRLILEQAENGLGVIVVSSELPVLFAVTDRILVMCEGRITREFTVVGTTEQDILEAALPQSMNESQ